MNFDELKRRVKESKFSDIDILRAVLPVELYNNELYIANNYYKWYYYISQMLEPRKIAEIGVYKGYSLLAMAKGSLNPILLGFDNESYEPETLEDALNNLKEYSVIFEKADTQGINDLKIRGIDLFHVDGDHSYFGCLHDLELALGALNNNGVILLDDVDFCKEVKSAGETFVWEHRLNYEYIAHHRGLWVIWKNEK